MMDRRVHCRREVSMNESKNEIRNQRQRSSSNLKKTHLRTKYQQGDVKHG